MSSLAISYSGSDHTINSTAGEKTAQQMPIDTQTSVSAQKGFSQLAEKRQGNGELECLCCPCYVIGAVGKCAVESGCLEVLAKAIVCLCKSAFALLKVCFNCICPTSCCPDESQRKELKREAAVEITNMPARAMAYTEAYIATPQFGSHHAAHPHRPVFLTRI